jgi:diguanylate cyclase (GGDEF)-like protein/PAS domain S-box-containing protein
MNVGRKLMLIVVTSVALVTIPAAIGIYQFTKNKLLTSEAAELEKDTNAIIATASENLSGYDLSMQALSNTLIKALSLPPQRGEEAAFNLLIEKSPDGAWRSKFKSNSGDMQSGLFLPPDAPLDAEQKRLHLRAKHVLDAFANSITSPTGNVWLLTLDKTEVVFDYNHPNLVDLIPADSDYTKTPWITLGDTSTNPGRRLRWTPPSYDAPSKLWRISAVMPLDVNGRWIGTIGRDFTLSEALSTLLQHNKRYEGEQQFLLDAEGNYIQAGPWQAELETKQENFRPDLSKEPDLAKLFSQRDSASKVHLLNEKLSLQGRDYLSIDTPITITGWHYYRLVPTSKILAPLRQLFYALVAMVLATGLLVGFLIDVAVKRNIVNRLQVLASAVRRYGLGELDARADLSGDDEITKTSQEFNAMAGQFKATLDALPDMLFEFGLDGTYYSAHTPTDNFLLAPAKELIGKTVSEVLPSEHAAIIMAAIQEANETGYSQGKQYQRMTSQGLSWFELSIAKKAGGDSQSSRFMAISRNISERKLAAERIQHLAFYDLLTGLPNRRLLLDRLNHALSTSARSGRSGAILFLDLDNFKTLNDTLGHSIGDQLLQAVGKRLTECLREGDTVARLGGDEYVAVLEDLSDQAIESAAQAEIIANKILSALNRPYILAARDYHNTPSIGVTLFKGHEIEVEELLRQADIAMYQAKKAGRNTVRFFNPQMQENITHRAALESELRVALEQQQFQLYYQIQVNHLGGVLGAEALLRWAHPERGLLPPFQFVPLAEETSLILPIGDWVLETACAQIKTWQRNKHTSKLVLSINVSAKQFHQEYFVEQVQAAVLDNGINPALLKLELTESMLLNDAASTIETMSALKEIGVQFSLDDFGTGFSSLQYLKRIPLNQLKIDQTFVRDIAVDASDQAIVQTIIAMAKTLNLNVIAEGVETKQQQELLLASGCKHFQGYLFGKPLPIKEFEKKLKPKLKLKLKPSSTTV